MFVLFFSFFLGAFGVLQKGRRLVVGVVVLLILAEIEDVVESFLFAVASTGLLEFFLLFFLNTSNLVHLFFFLLGGPWMDPCSKL